MDQVAEDPDMAGEEVTRDEKGSTRSKASSTESVV